MAEFQSIDVECVIRMGDGAVMRFATSADLTKVTEHADVGDAAGNRIAAVLDGFSRRLPSEDRTALERELEKAKQTIATLSEKYNAAKDRLEGKEPSAAPAKLARRRAAAKPKEG